MNPRVALNNAALAPFGVPISCERETVCARATRTKRFQPYSISLRSSKTILEDRRLKIAGVNFPEPLLNALRDSRVVVFAGAGVSMGPPAGLPDFRQLAKQVAEGTGQSIGDAETDDRFLGRLEDLGTDVHQRAAGILQRDNPKPTLLHLNLLRLFTEPRAARAVTTNFDDLFERAALGQFYSQIRVFQAPALPLGNRFHGIVHLHGSVDEPGEMVLTHRDFGRAYLTESDGWARRYLIDLFTNYTVLFVGYSHSDTIMTYLTPSLPPDGAQRRFALIGDKIDDPTRWRRMGIEPVIFQQAHANDFSGLDVAVSGLARFLQRGVLDWQREITAIAGGSPPIDDESAGIIEHALSDPVTTRFFVDSAESPEWVEWLGRSGHLADLFTDGELCERDQRLGWWLVSRFAIAHDSALFALIERYDFRLNSALWRQLSWQMQDSIAQSPDAKVMMRWVFFLSSVIPTDADDVALSWLAEACASVRATDGLLRVYEAMMKRLNRVPPRPEWRNSDESQYYARKILSDFIKPNLPEMSEPLLALVTTRLKERHAILAAWEGGDATSHLDNFSRSAIEPHEQDDLSREIDPLIDAARECLEWLAANAPVVTGVWCDRFSSSDAPLLRRLAIHALAARNDLSADDKIAWLLERYDVNEIAVHHEIFRAVALEYPQAGSWQKTALIQAISEYRAPESEHYDSEEISAHHRFTWSHWLHHADPDCSIAKETLDTVWSQHPDFVAPEHPDFTHYQYHWSRGGSIAQSAWDVGALLAQQAAEALPDLLTYQPTEQQRFDGHNRWAMLSAVKQAAEANPSWGLDLADAMAEIGAWNSDLWQHVITAWTTAELDQNGVNRVLSHLSVGELQQQHPREIASILSEVVRKTEESEATGLPGAANSIAVTLRPYVSLDELPELTASVGGVPQYVSWLDKAINHASGKLALFWVHSIVLWRRQQEHTPQSLSAAYREALGAIVEEDGVLGKFGRTVLTSNFHFFLAIDEDWTINNLLPLFDTEHEDFQCAWDGFLTWGQLSPQIADLLREKFVDAVPQVFQEFQGKMLTRFVEFYVAAMGWLINGANDDWITEFFKHADEETKNQFAIAVGHRLRDLDESRQQEWWNVWLKDYWRNRLQGVPDRLDDAEIAQMLEWVIHFPVVFSEAVELAIQMPLVTLTRSHILRNLGENELIERYPEDLAKFLIHLGRHDTGPWFWASARKVFDKLLTKGLRADLNQGLHELIVRHNLN